MCLSVCMCRCVCMCLCVYIHACVCVCVCQKSVCQSVCSVCVCVCVCVCVSYWERNWTANHTAAYIRPLANQESTSRSAMNPTNQMTRKGVPSITFWRKSWGPERDCFYLYSTYFRLYNSLSSFFSFLTLSCFCLISRTDIFNWFACEYLKLCWNV